MRIILINLARAAERLAKMDKQFTALGLAYERLEATDGGNLTRDDRLLVDNEKRKWYTEYPLSDNEVGCWLSHRHALLGLIESGDDMAVVVEDDAELLPDFAKLLQAVSENPPQFDFIFLHRKFKAGEKFFPVKDLIPGLRLGVVGYAHMGAIAYIVSREGAQKFVRHAPRFVHAVDKTMHRYWSNGLRIYGLERPVVITNDHGHSYIEETRQQDNNASVRARYHDSRQWFWWLMRRCTRVSESLRKYGTFPFYLSSRRQENNSLS